MILTALGVLGDSHFVGGQIRSLSREITEEINGVRDELKDLHTQQKVLEHHNMPFADRILKDCGKSK